MLLLLNANDDVNDVVAPDDHVRLSIKIALCVCVFYLIGVFTHYIILTYNTAFSRAYVEMTVKCQSCCARCSKTGHIASRQTFHRDAGQTG